MWRVNGLNNNHCEISLNHSQFAISDVIQIQCNDSTVTILKLQAVAIERNCYTTQLTILSDHNSRLNGGSIECHVGHEFGTLTENLIGTVALIFSTHSKCM